MEHENIEITVLPPAPNGFRYSAKPAVEGGSCVDIEILSTLALGDGPSRWKYSNQIFKNESGTTLRSKEK